MNLKILFLFGLLLFYQSASCQSNFDSIHICSKGGELAKVVIAEYDIEVKGGRLSVLRSKDGAVEYNEENRAFTLRNLIKGTALGLKLTSDGVLINTNDTTFLLSSPKSINLPSDNESGSAYGLCSIGDFSFSCEFDNDKITKIGIPTTGKYVIINTVQLSGSYIWDFLIESANHVNQVLLTYSFNAPYSLSIKDDRNKVGIRLLSEKKNGIFTIVHSLKYHNDGVFVSEESYKLNFNRNGRLKKKSGFNFNCED